MLPIADGSRLRRVPIVTYLLILANVLVFLFELQLSARGLDRFTLNWGMIPRNVLLAFEHPSAPYAPHVFLTLLTSQFIHGGWLHLLGNMLFLWIFGDDVEDRLGSLTFLVFYLVSGVVAGLAEVFVLSQFVGGLNLPNVGASGAIAGILGAYLVLYPVRRVTVIIPIFFFPIPLMLPAFVMIVWWFIQQFFYGIASLTPMAAQSGGVAFWAHIGGFLFGLLITLPLAVYDRARMHQTWET